MRWYDRVLGRPGTANHLHLTRLITTPKCHHWIFTGLMLWLTPSQQKLHWRQHDVDMTIINTSSLKEVDIAQQTVATYPHLWQGVNVNGQKWNSLLSAASSVCGWWQMSLDVMSAASLLTFHWKLKAHWQSYPDIIYWLSLSCATVDLVDFLTQATLNSL